MLYRYHGCQTHYFGEKGVIATKYKTEKIFVSYEQLGAQIPIIMQKYGNFVSKPKLIYFRKHKNTYADLRNLSHCS